MVTIRAMQRQRKTSVDAAYRGMRALLRDAGRGEARFERDPEASEPEGYFAFLVHIGGDPVPVLMPGRPLREIRFTGAPGQDAWTTPRLYVDGSSWLWKYAASQLRERGE